MKFEKNVQSKISKQKNCFETFQIFAKKNIKTLPLFSEFLLGRHDNFDFCKFRLFFLNFHLLVC